jgi:carbonic anhydrase
MIARRLTPRLLPGLFLASERGMIDFADDAQDLIAGYRRFRGRRYREARDLFRTLQETQRPATMIIACADSRADPAMIFDAAPGELFVVRNVAALVPPYEESSGLHGVSAALEFAVTVLKVKQVLVMGHGGCGGIAASLAAADHRPIGRFIAPWVEIAAEARDAVLNDATIPTRDWQEAVEHGAVGQSLKNLMSFPFVRSGVETGALNLDGAWFSIGKGELHWRNPEDGAFSVVAAEDAEIDQDNKL